MTKEKNKIILVIILILISLIALVGLCLLNHLKVKNLVWK